MYLQLHYSLTHLLTHSLTAFSSDLSTASINIAEGRPAAQISTDGKSTADLAVDGDRNVCAKTERGSENPWWRVDLGHKVWVNKVLLATKTALSDVGIKIGR